MKTETFSYLPPLTREQIVKQVQYILKNRYIPGVEYTDSPGPANHYWSMWKLPLFAAGSVEEVLTELEACRAANPGCYVKLNGYDPIKQGQIVSFVVHRP